jgi:two-component system, chemotaxis family, chemotaxis protein CheY
MGSVIAAPSPSMRRILRNTLHRFGIDDVQEFSDGLKALEACDESTSFIITAWTMEGFDGIELAKQIRANAETSHIPILMVTVRNSKDDVLEARQAGISAYMLQPFLAEQFRSKIEQLLQMCVKPTGDYHADSSSSRASHSVDAEDEVPVSTDSDAVATELEELASTSDGLESTADPSSADAMPSPPEEEMKAA